MTGLDGAGWSLPPEVDPNVPSVARLYDLYLGGAHHFESDRKLAAQIFAKIPKIADMARANRSFVTRAVQELATRGLAQFLDIGCGLPTMGAVHEVARRFAPDAPVVYVDNDPVAVGLGDVIIAKYGIRRAAMVQGDVRNPVEFLDDPVTLDVLDFGEPMVVVLAAVLHFVSDQDHPTDIMAALRTRVARGSMMVFSHGTPQLTDESAEVTELYRQRSTSAVFVRSRGEIEELLQGTGWEIEVPLQWVTDIYPDGEPPESMVGAETNMYGAILRAV